MVIVIRAALLAAVVSLAATLPAAAQQAPSDPAAEAPTADAAPAGERAVADMEAMVQRLKQDLQTLTESARQGAQNVLNRESPYVITADQLAAIAAGAVAGAIIIDVMGGGGLATLTGAAVGGVAGHWLYTQPAAAPAPAPNGTQDG